MQKFSTKQLVFAALCVALGVVLPQVFHAVPNAGNVLLPMHIPVLLCGLTCGWPYGLACGILAPLTSSLITGMPGPAYLPAMVCELAAYGLVAGLLYRHLPKRPANIYAALIGAMLAGRVVWGAARVVLSGVSGELFTWEMFMAGAFFKAIPGIIVHIALIPLLVMALKRAGFFGRTAPLPA